MKAKSTTTTNIKLVMGIDISQDTFNYALYCFDNKELIKSGKLTNDKIGFKKLLANIVADSGGSTLFVMEASGVYGLKLAHFLYEKAAKGSKVSVLNPLIIKHYANSSLSRAKTDKSHARLIAHYALRHSEQLRLWQNPDQNIAKLKSLYQPYNKSKTLNLIKITSVFVFGKSF